MQHAPERKYPGLGLLMTGLGLVALGLLLACLTFDPDSGSVSVAAWLAVLVGSVFAAVGIGVLTPDDEP